MLYTVFGEARQEPSGIARFTEYSLLICLVPAPYDCRVLYNAVASDLVRAIALWLGRCLDGRSRTRSADAPGHSHLNATSSPMTSRMASQPCPPLQASKRPLAERRGGMTPIEHRDRGIGPMAAQNTQSGYRTPVADPVRPSAAPRPVACCPASPWSVPESPAVRDRLMTISAVIYRLAMISITGHLLLRGIRPWRYTFTS